MLPTPHTKPPPKPPLRTPQSPKTNPTPHPQPKSPAAAPHRAPQIPCASSRADQPHPPAQLPAPLNPIHLAAEPPAGSCSSPAPPQDAPKTTADAAQKTTALPQDAQPHSTALALFPPR